MLSSCLFEPSVGLWMCKSCSNQRQHQHHPLECMLFRSSSSSLFGSACIMLWFKCSEERGLVQREILFSTRSFHYWRSLTSGSGDSHACRNGLLAVHIACSLFMLLFTVDVACSYCLFTVHIACSLFTHQLIAPNLLPRKEIDENQLFIDERAAQVE